MRRMVVMVSCLVVGLGACSSDKKTASSSTTTTRVRAASTTSTTAATTTTSPGIITTTTGAACPNTGTTNPTSTPANQPAALLTGVGVTTAGCRDSVTFTFKQSGAAVPSCAVAYKPGPFTKDASGAPVTVAGSAFVTVRCESAFSYDPATGATTYSGPETITPTGTRHVRQVVETGDFEGVINWVIGLDRQRAYGITAGGVPTRRLVITFS